jgi:hypothetical protein
MRVASACIRAAARMVRLTGSITGVPIFICLNSESDIFTSNGLAALFAVSLCASL